MALPVYIGPSITRGNAVRHLPPHAFGEGIKMNWSLRLVALAALALAGCATKPTQAPENFDLSIAVGRLGVMLDHEETALGVLLPDEPWSPLGTLGGNASSAETFRTQYVQLRLNALHQEAIRTEVCERGVVSGAPCAARALPGWVSSPVQRTPTAIEIEAWTADLQARIMPLWSALCDRARSKTGDAMQCAIE